MTRLYALADGNGEPVAIRGYLAANLRRLLKERGWRQRDLAKRAGLSEPTVSGLVNGENWIGDETVDRLADVFGVDSEEFFKNPASVKPKPSDEYMEAMKIITKKLDDLIKKG